MKSFYIAFVLLIIFPCFVLANTAAENKSSSNLTVVVVNKTENGTSVENDEVTLEIYQHQQVYDILEGNVSAEGKVVFEDVPTGEQFIAVPRAKHKDMMFTGQAVVLNSTEGKLDAQVEVFDVSTDKSKLFVQMHHLIIKPSTETNVLEVTEFMQLVNDSNMAISSDERDKKGNAIVLNLSLPKGFSNLEWSSYFEKDAIVITNDGFYDIMAVPPGSYQLTFSYTLDISASTMDIVKKISLPTERLMVLGQGVHLQSKENIEAQTMNMGGVSTEFLRFNDIVAPEKITFQVSGLTFDKHSWITWIIVASVFVAMIVIAIVRSGKGNEKIAQNN